ncbi:MAG: response regulator [Nitrosomonas sp.]|nr:response regulator [Nitrosomonas sp.]MDP1950905.1 response regulator [Nitrosomonas sp.]
MDDSATDRHVLSNILTRHGYRVGLAKNGEESRVMTKETMDLISMDVIMPGLDGFQATRKTVRDKVTPQIPVILSTANSQTTDKI